MSLVQKGDFIIGQGQDPWAERAALGFFFFNFILKRVSTSCGKGAEAERGGERETQGDSMLSLEPELFLIWKSKH